MVAAIEHQVVENNQHVSIHTAGGAQMYQFSPRQQSSLTWARELREVSRCELQGATPLQDGEELDIFPWLHWVSVWDENQVDLLWTGPITKVTSNKRMMNISGLDVSAFYSRTRCPLTKAWDASDPADIANELWARMIEHHRLPCEPIVLQNPFGRRFDFKSEAQTTMLNQVMDDLVQKGLFWSVVAGVPILGPVKRTIVASLGEEHFLNPDGPTLTRDGTGIYNDVLLKAADARIYATSELDGLRLQNIVNADSIFQVSNAQAAAERYVSYSAMYRDTLDLSNGMVLAPNAPVSMDDLIPTARIKLTAMGTTMTTQVRRVEVSSAQGYVQTSLSLDLVDDGLPELINLQSGLPTTGYDS